MKDLHSDTNPKTGYLVETPKGAYGKKVKELVHYFSSQSVELKAIRHSRKIKPNACCLYGFYIFQFLSEYVFPIVFAVLASYFYYAWTPIHSPVEETITAVPIENSTGTASGWFGWMPNSDVAGQWVGSALRSVVAVPLSFVVNAVDRGLHAKEAMEAVQLTGTKLILLPLLFIAVYFLTKIVGRVCVHLQTLCASQRRVWDLQELMIQETEEALERAITGLCKPFLLKTYEEFLALPTESTQQIVPANQTITTLTKVYQHNYPLLQINLHERLATEIKQIPFPELVRRGGLSQSYTQVLRQLVRYADEELSSLLFTFHEEIHKVPTTIQSRLLDAGQSVAQGTTRLASNAMILATVL